MSTTYKVQTGDTFDLISRKSYGVETEAQNIAQANPGVTEPLVAGISIIIPEQQDAPENLPQQTAATTGEEVAMLIEGVRFRFWSRVSITRSIDTMDSIEFEAPFDADDKTARDTFRPFSYKTVVITIGGEPFFKGTIINITPSISSSGSTVSVGGYSLPGVLNDCTPPASSFPLEFNGQGLREIANSMIKPFGIKLEFSVDQGAVFDRVASDPGKKVLDFLADLAKQRNLVISSTPNGALEFLQSTNGGSPIARLDQEASPVLSVSPSFSPQEYYSHITGIEPAIVGLKGSQYTVKNERLTSVIRPHTFEVTDAISADVKSSVEAKAGRMFGNMVSYKVTVATWRDPSGNLWKPNTTVKLKAKNAMIYNEFEFVIRSVTFERDRKTEITTLSLIIPGAFSGQIPGVLPWDE